MGDVSASRRKDVFMATRLFLFPQAQPRDPAVEAWRQRQAGPLGAVARHWFTALRQAGTHVHELMHDGHPTACFNSAAFAYVGTFQAHVTVGFFHGSDLRDPTGILQGTGRFMRHVKLRDAQPDPALVTLIHVAFQDIQSRVAATDLQAR